MPARARAACGSAAAIDSSSSARRWGVIAAGSGSGNGPAVSRPAPARTIARAGALVRGQPSGDEVADLLQRRRVLDRRQVAGVAALADGLDRAPQQLARARLR